MPTSLNASEYFGGNQEAKTIRINPNGKHIFGFEMLVGLGCTEPQSPDPSPPHHADSSPQHHPPATSHTTTTPHCHRRTPPHTPPPQPQPHTNNNNNNNNNNNTHHHHHQHNHHHTHTPPPRSSPSPEYLQVLEHYLVVLVQTDRVPGKIRIKAPIFGTPQPKVHQSARKPANNY